jgi:hypothetical protein
MKRGNIYDSTCRVGKKIFHRVRVFIEIGPGIVKGKISNPMGNPVPKNNAA